MEYLPIVAACLSVALNGIIGLVVWGVRGEITTLRTEMKLQRAETSTALAQAANEFYTKVNGNYVRKDLYTEMHERVGRIEDRIE